MLTQEIGQRFAHLGFLQDPEDLLLCDVDVPWVADAVRDSPDVREHLHARFVNALDALGVPYVNIRGSWAERLQMAIDAVAALYPRNG